MDLSCRYLPQRFLPDKAIDLVDEAASRARLAGRSLPPELQALELRACLLYTSLPPDYASSPPRVRVARAFVLVLWSIVTHPADRFNEIFDEK